MGFARSYLVSLLLCVSIVNEIHFPTVTCQDEGSVLTGSSSQCIPRKAFLALLRLPEVSSNLAAYSRTARINQESKGRNEMVDLAALTTAIGNGGEAAGAMDSGAGAGNTRDDDEDEICIPGSLYLELFREPGMRAHLTSVGRTPKLPDYPFGRSFEDTTDTGKRSIATLAKNDDLPASIQDRKEGDEADEAGEEELRDAMGERRIQNTEDRKRNTDYDRYEVSSGPGTAGSFNVPPPVGYYFPISPKRNVGSLARDFALPSAGRRNIGSLARDHALPNGKRNIASLARDYVLPRGSSGKRLNSRDGYREEREGNELKAAGNRYLVLSTPLGVLDEVRDGLVQPRKRSVALPPGSLILRALSRKGRSDQSFEANDEPFKPYFARLALRYDDDDDDEDEEDMTAWSRGKRRLAFSEEYPLPVMQNANDLDYEEMIETLAGRYPTNQKRFMGRIPQMGPRPTTPPTRRLGR